jgi:[acyl-carrier-protein] S-malonyltransferase
MILNDPASLFANRHAQAMVVGYGVAAWAALAPQLPRPNLVAGYSVGELTAYGVAGSLAMPDLRRLTDKRAEWMDFAAAQLADQAQGLLALSGVAWAGLLPLFAQHQVYLAIDNGAQSCVLGGMHTELAAVAQAATGLGARTQSLAVTVAAHTPLMFDAVSPWLADLRTAAWSAPMCPVLAGISAEQVPGQGQGQWQNQWQKQWQKQALQNLAQQLATPIRWADNMDALAEAGVNVALELGPGNALARMMQTRHPQIACRSLSDFRTIAAAVQWVLR